MSNTLINQYYNDVECALQFGKSKNEKVIRNNFWLHLIHYSHDNNYKVIHKILFLCSKNLKSIPLVFSKVS